MLIDESGPPPRRRSLHTPCGDRSGKLLRDFGLSTAEPSAEEDVNRLIEHFCAGWRVRDPLAPAPDMQGVRAEMNKVDDKMLWLWGLARERIAPGMPAPPQVAIAAVVERSNPFILRNCAGTVLVVMPEIYRMMFRWVVLGVLTYADGPASHEQASLTLIRKAVREWRTRDPNDGPEGRLMVEMATLDQDATTFAAGLADAAFTWTYLHELGHHLLKHRATRSLPLGALDDSEFSDESSRPVVPVYAHQEEIAADRFGYEGLLGLMPVENLIRSHEVHAMAFGRQIDHAPLIAMEIVNLALRLEGREGDLDTPSHPAPLKRRDILRDFCAEKVCDEGREFYHCWHERLRHAGLALRVADSRL